MNRNFISFPFHEKDLNLKLNMGISAIIKTESTDAVLYKTLPVKIVCAKPKLLFKKIKSKPTTNKAAAGVANPIKLSLCRSSILNFAKRRAAKRVSTNAGADAT